MPGIVDMEHLTDVDKWTMECVQKRIEAKLERRKVSEGCSEIMAWITGLEEEDTMLKGGISEDKNPFKEIKGGCVIC